MGYILTSEAQCQYCYKCLRNCPIKSIGFKEGKSFILSEDCILCGDCIDVCPQKARTYLKEINRFKKLINSPFLVSIAPSFFAHFDEPLKVIGLLKSLGAVIVQETALGADLVSSYYRRIFLESKKTLITTSCPVIVDLAEFYFPEAIEYLAPVLSPMNTHAIFMREFFGDLPIIYIGPCIAKKKEGKDILVITFEELDSFIEEEKMNISSFKDTLPDPPYPNRGRVYPISGGINSTLDGDWKRHIVVEGIKNVIEIFKGISTMESGFFIEASSCIGGCIQGPAIRKDLSYLEKRNRILYYQEILKSAGDSRPIYFDIDISRRFSSKKRSIFIREEDIIGVLRSIGKDDPKKELNCGACGYNSCREKAIAVLQGKAEREMCITYMIDKATSVSNLIVEEFPNIVIIYKDKHPIYLNPAGEEFLSNRKELINHIIFEIEDNNATVIDLDIDTKKYSFFVKTFALPNDYGKVAMLIDITREREQRSQIEVLKQESLVKMEEVINKQMRLAQEIAGLLGESIAETKSQFLAFKRYLEEEDVNL